MRRDITVIGASAGGITALRTLFSMLPPDYAAAIFVVVHVAPESPSLLAKLFARSGPLPAIEARDGLPIVPGRIVVAAPDQHLLLGPEGVAVRRGPRENRHRPSVDVLFRSAAVAFGARVSAVVLSGMLDDGSAGLWAVKRRGGLALVQHPDDAEFPDMPRNALQSVKADHCLPVAEIAPVLDRIARERVHATRDAPPQDMTMEVAMAQGDSSIDQLDELGRRVPLTCPECGGALWELKAEAARYRCHVGHAYSAHTLASEQLLRVEAALWAALRSLEENERIARRLADIAVDRGASHSPAVHEQTARTSAAHAEILRGLLTQAAPSATAAGESAARVARS